MLLKQHLNRKSADIWGERNRSQAIDLKHSQQIRKGSNMLLLHITFTSSHPGDQLYKSKTDLTLAKYGMIGKGSQATHAQRTEAWSFEVVYEVLDRGSHILEFSFQVDKLTHQRCGPCPFGWRVLRLLLQCVERVHCHLEPANAFTSSFFL